MMEERLSEDDSITLQVQMDSSLVYNCVMFTSWLCLYTYIHTIENKVWPDTVWENDVHSYKQSSFNELHCECAVDCKQYRKSPLLPHNWYTSNTSLVYHSLLTELLVDIYSILVEMQLWQSNAWNYCIDWDEQYSY